MLDSLLLLSGNDIPFTEANITIHNPTLKEIAYVGEENFLKGYQLLNISKQFLPEEGKLNLGDISDFDILIAILKERNAVMQKNRSCVFMVLALLFPSYAISILDEGIVLKKEEEVSKISKEHFDIFKSLIKQMFSFGVEDEQDFNPNGALAEKIAKKMRERQQRLANLHKEDSTKVDIYSRYASIISVGLNIPITKVMEFTPYQLFDQVNRYRLKDEYEINLKARLAGAKDIKDPEDWMKDVHSKS